MQHSVLYSMLQRGAWYSKSPMAWKGWRLLIQMKVTERSLRGKHIFIIMCSALSCEPSEHLVLIAQQLSRRKADHADAFTTSSNRCSISNPTRSRSVSGSKSWPSVRKGCGHCVPYEIPALLLVVIGWVVSVVTCCLTDPAPPFCQLAIRKLSTLKLCLETHIIFLFNSHYGSQHK